MKEAFEKILERLSNIRICVKTDEDAEWNRAIYKAEEVVQEVAEEYNNGWIPVSERLPDIELEKERNERGSDAVFPVLATINKVNISGEKYTTVNRAFYGCYNNDKNFYNYCCDKLDVIAWMPLPEPYQKGE